MLASECALVVCCELVLICCVVVVVVVCCVVVCLYPLVGSRHVLAAVLAAVHQIEVSVWQGMGRASFCSASSRGGCTLSLISSLPSLPPPLAL